MPPLSPPAGPPPGYRDLYGPSDRAERDASATLELGRVASMRNTEKILDFSSKHLFSCELIENVCVLMVPISLNEIYSSVRADRWPRFARGGARDPYAERDAPPPDPRSAAPAPATPARGNGEVEDREKRVKVHLLRCDIEVVGFVAGKNV